MKINGTEIADKIFNELKAKAEKQKGKNIIPHLAIILISNDPASISYIEQKDLKAQQIGAKTTIRHLSSDTSQPELLKTIQQFNNNNSVHGIIVQRPLPTHIDNNVITKAIDPKKDVDGFHPATPFQSPLALAVLKILEEVFNRLHLNQGVALANSTPRRWPNGLLRGGLREWLMSKKIVIIGKGETGGKPVIDFLKKIGVDTLIIDSKTPNPANITKTADIIISAVGKESIVKPEMIKKNSILISIGLSKGKDDKLHADYDEEKIKNIVSFYTPTPGGVGPVNVAMLLKNVIKTIK